MAIAPAGRGFEVLGVYGLFLALTTLTVGLRAYCRLRIQKAFGWDDWFATLSWVSTPAAFCAELMLNCDRFSLFYMLVSPSPVYTMGPASMPGISNRRPCCP